MDKRKSTGTQARRQSKAPKYTGHAHLLQLTLGARDISRQRSMEVHQANMELSLAFIAWTLCLMAFSYLLLSFFKRLLWDPVLLSHRLGRGGLVVLPYTPVFGNLLHLKQLCDVAATLALPSPSDHNICSLVLPFHAHVSSRKGTSFIFWWGPQPRLVVTDPDDIKQILSSRFKDYRRTRGTLKFLRRLLGVGLLTAEGEDWHNQRSILRHAFFPDKLNGMVDTMSTCAMEMIQAWEKRVKKEGGKAEVEVAHYIENTMVDIITRTSFRSSYEKGKEVFEKQRQLVELMMQDIVANSVIPGYKYMPTRANIRYWKLEKSIEKELRERIEAQKALVWVKDSGRSHGEDLLGLMLASEEEAVDSKSIMRLSTRQLVDDCKAFFFAGHETTSRLLAWTIVLLGHDTIWQERAREEVLRELGGHAPSANTLSKLKILGTIFYETLRLYPPVAALSPRVVATDERKGMQLRSMKGVEVPKEMSFCIPVLYLHRDKALWGDNADEFAPDRFNEGISNACKHPCAYLPFGFGPRTCIGQNFALMEAKVVMASLLQRFRFRLSPNYVHSPRAAITMRPGHGVPVILETLNSTW